MPRYEYKVVPAPTKGLKAKNVKGAEARFSHALQELMNGLSGYGWEYQRAETLPSIERAGLTGSTTEWRNVLVFRRLRESEPEDQTASTELLPPPQPDTTEPEPEPEPEAETAQAEVTSDAPYFEDEHGETKDDGKTAVVAPSLLNALASRRKSTTVKTPATAAEPAPKTEADTTAPETETAKTDKTAD
jgi:cell division septation protein DedD